MSRDGTDRDISTTPNPRTRDREQRPRAFHDAMNPMQKWWAGALCAIGVVVAQDPAAALAHARLVEQQEGDLPAAEREYRTLLADGGDDAVHAEAALRLGSLLWRLDQKADAKPFLERAVAAGGELAAAANRVLQGQDDAERLTKARTLVQRYVELLDQPRQPDGSLSPETQGAFDSVAGELGWLGDAAARAICEQLDRTPQTFRRDVNWTDPQFGTQRKLVAKLWQLGGPSARTWLGTQLEQAPVAWLRLLADHEQACASDLRDMVTRFLLVADPTGEVWHASLHSVLAFPLAELTALAKDPQVALRCAAYDALSSIWQRLGDEEREPIATSVVPQLLATAHSADPRSVYAWALLKRFGEWGPRAARSVFLGEVASFPADMLSAFHNDSKLGIDDRDLGAMATASRQLAPIADALRTKRGAPEAIERLLRTCRPTWTAAGIAAWIQLVELGYQDVEAGSVHSVAVAADGDLPALIRTLPKVAWNGIHELANRSLPANTMPALADVTAIAATSDERTAGAIMNSLLPAVASIGTPEAAACLRDVVQRAPTLTPYVVGPAIQMSQLADSEPARALLRELLVRENTAKVDPTPQARTLVLAELVRIGDLATIPLLPRACSLGFGEAWTLAFRTDPAIAPMRVSDGLGLFLECRTATGDLRRWHGYGDADFDSAWQQLVAERGIDAVRALLSIEIFAGSHNHATAMRPCVPLAALPRLADAIRASWRGLSDRERNQLVRLLENLGDLPTTDVIPAPLDAAIHRLLTATDVDLVFEVLQQLPRPIAVANADEALVALRREPTAGRLAFVRNLGLDVDTATWRRLLTDANMDVRANVLPQVPKQLARELRPDVEALLADPVAEVRANACLMVRSLYGLEAVPALLPILQDDDNSVRSAARNMLNQLREEQEQRAFWANAKAGIDTSPAGAATKLVAQAQPDQPKEQRVLAIRSLAVLAAPETLPYLIERTSDPDAEIAAAARAAITAILAKTPPAAGKDH